ncbi:MAG: PD-(D/E)XK nuclease family protein [Chloroflexi bacterium]|nr:PD-(D/E)XK nuclease family protein [Chloroflexota bacterium]
MAELQLSPSQLAAYQDCPRRYLATQGQRETTAAMSLGAAVHEALFHWHQRGGFGMLGQEALLALLADHWRREGYADRSAEAASYHRGQASLRAYYAAGPGPGVPIAHEAYRRCTVQLHGHRLQLRGRFDRVDLLPGIAGPSPGAGGRIAVVDYKVSRIEPPLARQLALSPAIVAYYLLARAHYPHYAEVRVTVLYLRPEGVVRREIAYPPAGAARAREWLADVVGGLIEGEMQPRSGAFCVRCRVQDSCPTGHCPTLTLGLEGGSYGPTKVC